jgi:hypothetical protein
MVSDGSTNAKLTLDDIADLRAYERQRESFRSEVIALKRLRRIGVGPVLTLVFENALTVRFQVQEMARAERMLTDEQIQIELDTYNRLIPEPGQLSATLFIELVSKDEMMEWLPKLVGIERSMEFLIGEGEGAEVVRAVVEEEHAAHLTRDEITASVHFVRFEFSAAQIAAFASQPVVLAANHPAYAEGAHLSDETRASLLQDLRG